MKRTLILAFVTVVCAASMTSCKKDYTCTCKVNGVAVPAVEIKDAKKKDAQNSCDALQTQVRLVDASGSCSL